MMYRLRCKMVQFVEKYGRQGTGVKCSLEKIYVDLPQSQNRIRTIVANKDSPKTPLVMIHGLCGGVGQWVQSIDSLSEKRPVYAIDVLGFGGSSRPKFGSHVKQVESQFVESIEDWRKEMKIEKMALLGHSFGAYLAIVYSLKYPEKIANLFLIDPWGFPDEPYGKTEQSRRNVKRIPTWVKDIGRILSLTPFVVFRAAGPLGPFLVNRYCQGGRKKFANVFDDNTILDYLYHCNAQKPSGEAAFVTLSLAPDYRDAKWPMVHRLAAIDAQLPITFINGSDSWIDTKWMKGYRRNGSRLDVEEIKGADHYLYAQKPDEFNRIINDYLDTIDLHAENERKKTLKLEADLKKYFFIQM